MDTRDESSAARVVVCGIDGRSHDANALEVAARLAELTGARLALAAVVPVPPHRRRDDVPSWTIEEALRALELTADVLEERVPVDCHLEFGVPVRRLAELAERERALPLVLGTGSADARGPASIAAGGLVRVAPCPVVVVPEQSRVPQLAPQARG